MVAIGRVLVLAAGVADPGGDHPVAPAQQFLHAPEAAAGEDRGLGVVGHGAPSVGYLGAASRRGAATCLNSAMYSPAAVAASSASPPPLVEFKPDCRHRALQADAAET